MTWDRVLGVIAVLLAIPGFLLLFFNGDGAVAAMVLLLGLFCFVVSLLWRWYCKLPPFTFVSTKVGLVFHGDDASQATFTKEYTVRPNHQHLTILTHRHIGADGTVSNIRWNGVPVSAEHIRKVMNDYEVDILFPGPLHRWTTFPGKLEYDLIDSFPTNTEGIVYLADFPTPKVEVVVRLPSGRPCSNAMAFKTTGAGRVPIGAPVVTDNGLTITLQIKKPTVGSEYMILWQW